MLPNIASRHYCTFIREGSIESHNVGFMSIAGKTKYGHLPSFLHATCKIAFAYYPAYWPHVWHVLSLKSSRIF